MLGKASSQLNEVIQLALSAGCHKLYSIIGDFCISINIEVFFLSLKNF